MTVVPNGVPEMEIDEIKPFPFRYLFLTGIYNPRKNVSFVISQLSELKKRNYHIIGVGADEKLFGNTEYKQDENLHILNYVDDKKYYTIMKHASALVFPSGYEGFGIPVLEALILGTPVIVPDLEIYRESFGELPLYYDAGNAKSFIESLGKINNYQPDINELLHLKNKYTFDNAAEILTDIIKRYQVKTNKG
jgi:glycosyltransferase involved in cell wall biosynthesis